MDPPVGHQGADRQPRDLAPHRVEARDRQGLGGVVDDHVDAGGGLERADVAALAADQPTLHVVGRQGHDRHRALVDELRGVALDRGRDDRLGAGLALALGLVGDALDLGGGRGLGLTAHRVLEAGAGGVGGQPGDLLEPRLGRGLGGLGLLEGGVDLLGLALGRALALVEVAGATLVVLALALEVALALAERLLAFGQLALALTELVVELGLTLGGQLLPGQLGRAPDLGGLGLGGAAQLGDRLVGRGRGGGGGALAPEPPPEPGADDGDRDQDDDVHAEVPRAGAPGAPR
jgi:hypothetical protein